MLIERLHERSKPFRIDGGVVVEQGHKLTAGDDDPRVDRFGEPTIVRALHHAHVGVMLPDPRDTAVGRSVVDQDDLEVRDGLPLKSRQALREVPQSVPVGDDDSDPR